LKDSFITEFQFLTLGSLKTSFRLTLLRYSRRYNSAYSNYSIEDTALLFVRIKANQYNENQNKILDKESELSSGDFLMVVKNNYFWLKDSDHAGFIANGDIIEV
jgi:hypothetical protein